MWKPKSEAELLEALSARTVDETHFLEFKRTAGDTDGERKETACDLAAFAIDGGVIVFGVDEVDSGVFRSAPIDLAALSERIEQIAANRVEPGLHIRTTALPSEDVHGVGYLVVEIPPSPSSPHMVDGRYWGRSEKTKRRLTDAEVVRLHAGRVGAHVQVRQALQEEADRSPAPAPRVRGYLVAEPQLTTPDLARTFTRQNARVMLQFASSAEEVVPADIRRWSPDPHELSAAVRRANGLARTNLGEGRTVRDDWSADNATDVEVRTTGSIRILLSSLSSTARDRRQPEVEKTMLFDSALVAWSFRLVGLAANLSKEIGYYGPWGLGIRVDGIAGASPWVEDDFALYRLAVYDAPSYERVTGASFSELDDAPGAVVGRMMEDLLLALESLDSYRTSLNLD
jgi:hypothetical protein